MENIKEFAVKVADEINNRFDGVTASLIHTVANNGVSTVKVQIRNMDLNVAPVIRLENFYNEFVNGKSFDTVFGEFIAFYEQTKPTESISMDWLQDYNQVRPLLGAKLVSLSLNKKNLERDGIVYKAVFKDLALIPVIEVNTTPAGAGAAKITEQMLSTWEISKDELINDTLTAVNQASYRVMRLSDTVESPLECPLYIITNEAMCYGAVSMLNNQLLSDVCDRIGCDKLIIIPSSVNEVIVMPENPDFPSDILNFMIKDVNTSCVSSEEVLSDHPYVWSKKTSKVTAY